jgi:DNA-binding transcriptional ArsR family regulator
MSDRTPHEQHDGPARMRREPQVLEADELAVYEALATLRRPLDAGELAATTGLAEPVVRAALDRLSELEMIETGKDGATVGPNSWDVRGRN